MREQYMLNGEGFVLVYSITDRDSFDSISAYHQQILRVKDTESVPIALVGNKCDLEDGRCVAKNGTSSHLSLPAACVTSASRMVHSMWNVVEGRYIGEELGCRFVETSAKLGLNVEETFLNLVRQIRDHNRVWCEFCLELLLGLSVLRTDHYSPWCRSCSICAAYHRW
jgi:GTPase KRas protein